MYEEQELSMQVFPEPDDGNAIPMVSMDHVTLSDESQHRQMSHDPSEHTYATLDRSHMFGSFGSDTNSPGPEDRTDQLY